MRLTVQVGGGSTVGETSGSMFLLLQLKTKGKEGEQVLGTPQREVGYGLEHPKKVYAYLWKLDWQCDLDLKSEKKGVLN